MSPALTLLAAAAAPPAERAAAAAAPSAAADRRPSLVLPNPIFEGSEKRVEIDFDVSASSPADGLRALSRGQLDHLMSLAACTIVSSRTNAHLDAYVLSESSLFVYPSKWVLKTCGTTKLLNAVPELLAMAAEHLGMTPRRCKYSRASFLFPEQQPAPYRDGFDVEARFLRSHFGHLGNGGSAYVLGDMFNGLQWHVFCADAHGADAAYKPASGRPFHKFEVCMTDLCREAASAFYRTNNAAFVSAAQTTIDTGIADLVPGECFGWLGASGCVGRLQESEAGWRRLESVRQHPPPNPSSPPPLITPIPPTPPHQQ
jgi:S-adenosylmethionine decarboxylase proenzyme